MRPQKEAFGTTLDTGNVTTPSRGTVEGPLRHPARRPSNLTPKWTKSNAATVGAVGCHRTDGA
jgi:hypothetical protein